MEGFLVVDRIYSFGSYRDPLNPQYKGVARVPPVPIPGESISDVLWDYVFGGVKDEETNLIPKLENAKRIYHGLKREGYDVEIVWVAENPGKSSSNQLESINLHGLGWDVASVRGDYWSIVLDFSHSAWAKPFRKALNEHGLFPARKIAYDYMEKYRSYREPDYDSPFEVVYVSRVEDC